MKIIDCFKQKYSDAKDLILIFLLKRKLKKAKIKETEMINKVLKLWQ